MKVFQFIATTLLSITFTFANCMAKDWRGIVPLKSTRADVEQLLGISTDKSNFVKYDLPEGVVYVEYSTYACNQAPVVEGWPTPPPGWNVPPDTVIAVEILLKQKLPLSALDIDLTKVKKVLAESDVSVHYNYINEEEGFTIMALEPEGSSDKFVRGFIYHPTMKEQHLRCPNTKDK